MAFDPEIDKISINELNDDLKRKINTNYESTEGLKEKFEAHVADVPHEEDPDYKTSSAKHIVKTERTYWNNLEVTLKNYTDNIIGQLSYSTVADGLADKVGIVNFELLTGTDWSTREHQTLRNLAFTADYADLYNAPAIDPDGTVKYAKAAKTAELATTATNADNAATAALANFATTANKSYDSYQVNSVIMVTTDTMPTTASINELIGNTGISVTNVIWIDSVNYHMYLCLNFMSYTDATRTSHWHKIIA